MNVYSTTNLNYIIYSPAPIDTTNKRLNPKFMFIVFDLKEIINGTFQF